MLKIIRIDLLYQETQEIEINSAYEFFTVDKHDFKPSAVVLVDDASPILTVKILCFKTRGEFKTDKKFLYEYLGSLANFHFFAATPRPEMAVDKLLDALEKSKIILPH